MDETRLKQTVLQGLSSEGLEIKATPLHLSRYLVTFEVVREGIVPDGVVLRPAQ